MEERAFATRVVRASRLSPTFVRVTVTGDSLAEFAGHGYDQRINLAFLTDPAEAAAYDADEDWYATWQATPVARRPALRTYTVRSWRPADAELDLDFVLHGAAGPASRFAATAKPGTPLTVCGPVVGHAFPASADVAWAPPPDAGRLLIAADEAAVPAASAIVEALPPGAPATVVLEVPEPADAVPFATPAGVEVVWLARCRGERLMPVVREIVAALPPASAPASVPAPPPCRRATRTSSGMCRMPRRSAVSTPGSRARRAPWSGCAGTWSGSGGSTGGRWRSWGTGGAGVRR